MRITNCQKSETKAKASTLSYIIITHTHTYRHPYINVKIIMVVIATFVYMCIYVVIPHHTLLRQILAVGQLSVGSPPPLKSTCYTAVYITIHTEHNVVHVHTHTRVSSTQISVCTYVKEVTNLRLRYSLIYY